MTSTSTPRDTNSLPELATGTMEKQQHAQRDASQAPSHKRQKSRHRASVACASCRDRRIRCVVPPGEAECTQCKRSGVQCIIKNDDERRRPISRAYMSSLTERVALLENMLREKNVEPPPANHPPKTRAGLPREERSRERKDKANKAAQLQSTSQIQPAEPQHSSPGSQGDELPDLEIPEHDSNRAHSDGDSVPSPPVFAASAKEGMVSRLLSTRGHLSFDQLSGRLRYFGPTTNCHVHSDLAMPFDETPQALEQAQRAEKTIRYLAMETYDYLMDLFWDNYNSVIHVIHREAFNEDREAGRTQFYSGFLHICILAMGYRFADKTRPDMQKIALPQRESTLHREAKYMLDYELGRPGGVSSIAALLLLGDLECGVGRDNLGWLYSGLAMRIAFDIGLHLDTRLSGLPEREVEIRQMTLWACVIYDKYWALFLGRPTTMKSADLEIYSLSKQFERLGTCRPAGPQKSLETQIYEALLDLMELAGKITENTDPKAAQSDANTDSNAYLRMAALDREFSNWYARLPEPLRWMPHNIQTAPFSFFLLHQQYHSALILLHRPFAKYEDSNGSDSEDNSASENHFSALSRTTCTKHAIRVARIFWQHRRRFNTKQIFVTGMQHAGTAATALVAALAFMKDSSDRSNNMQYLECLSAALEDMAYTYQPAERMSVVLHAVMAELRGDPHLLFRSRGALVPARRGSHNEAPEAPSLKRRQTSRSRPAKTMRSASFSTNMSIDLNINPGLASAHADKESDRHLDGFIMVTPRSEICSWSSIPMDNAMDPALPSAATAPLQARSAWMGADVDPSVDTAHLTSVHFPEIPSLQEDEGKYDNSHLDFMALGGDEWREWQGVAIGAADEGFQPGSFGSGLIEGAGRYAGMVGT